MKQERPVANAAPARSSGPAFAIPRITARELLAGHNEIVITHGDREYRLRITQNGKLILTA
jgi:hemin uptake protein HemP